MGRDEPKKLKISLATTCRDRLYHLRKTLPRNIHENQHYPNVEFVLLDYNSNDGLERWVKTEMSEYMDRHILCYYRTTEPEFFWMAHAKNMAALLCTGDVIVNVDADNYVGKGFTDVCNDIFVSHPRCFCRCGRFKSDLGSGGRVAIQRSDFLNLGGYDENMVGWGLEDCDLRYRSKRQGCYCVTFDSQFCRAIQHDDAVREASQTPPGQKKKTVGETSINNQRIYKHNTANNIITVNAGKVWGEGKVIYNFTDEYKVGSQFKKGFEKVHPADRKEAIPTRLSLSLSQQLLMPSRIAGRFVLSARNTSQVNQKV